MINWLNNVLGLLRRSPRHGQHTGQHAELHSDLHAVLHADLRAGIRAGIRAAAIFATILAAVVAASGGPVNSARGETPQGHVLQAQPLLERERFWDNRDWDWYRDTIPLFDCPDRDITTTYYYRWELVTKHLTYGSPNSGYVFTEFIDRPFWSGRYGAISCPAGHQLYEVRWLRNPTYARDYARYWYRTPGAQPRNYSTWIADAAWAVHRVHPDEDGLRDLLPAMISNYRAWEERHFVGEIGLFWQTGHDDGMEFNINSRQTGDILRGAPAFRPTLNSYLIADAQAIARVAELAGNAEVAAEYRGKAERLTKTMLASLWDPRREFFFPRSRERETRDGHVVEPLTLTYETGKFSGSEHGRELHGYVPWQFGIPGAEYSAAWKPLLSKDGFWADFGPATVERRDPQFYLSPSCCWWSGQSWPYATSQTLKGLANLLQGANQDAATPEDYVRLLQIYAQTHRKAGRPYLAEAAHPDTGSFEGHDGYNHSEHYFHSSYCDLVITGLVGLMPRDDAKLEIKPLAPAEWDFFALDQVPYKHRLLTIIWDRTGAHYRRGAGLRVLADGVELAARGDLGPLTAELPPLARPFPEASEFKTVNFAVNNDGAYFPRATATFTAAGTSLTKMFDGNVWYHEHPPNRWTSADSPRPAESVTIDLGTPRPIHTVKLFFLDDVTERGAYAPANEPPDSPSRVQVPADYELAAWVGGAWRPIAGQSRHPAEPTGRRANTIRFPVLETQQIRLTLTHRPGAFAGLAEFEAWGDAKLPLETVPPPKGNLAYNKGDERFPKASASHTSRFDDVKMANDGVVSFAPQPHNRWTSYESPSKSDWLEIDFGEEKEFARVEFAVYDDRGGVQAPQSILLEYWRDDAWRPIPNVKADPARPTGGQFNELRFPAAKSTKIRLVFEHRDRARSGVSEVMVWEK